MPNNNVQVKGEFLFICGEGNFFESWKCYLSIADFQVWFYQWRPVYKYLLSTLYTLKTDNCWIYISKVQLRLIRGEPGTEKSVTLVFWEACTWLLIHSVNIYKFEHITEHLWALVFSSAKGDFNASFLTTYLTVITANYYCALLCQAQG